MSVFSVNARYVLETPQNLSYTQPVSKILFKLRRRGILYAVVLYTQTQTRTHVTGTWTETNFKFDFKPENASEPIKYAFSGSLDGTKVNGSYTCTNECDGTSITKPFTYTCKNVEFFDDADELAFGPGLSRDSVASNEDGVRASLGKNSVGTSNSLAPNRSSDLPDDTRNRARAKSTPSTSEKDTSSSKYADLKREERLKQIRERRSSRRLTAAEIQEAANSANAVIAAQPSSSISASTAPPTSSSQSTHPMLSSSASPKPSTLHVGPHVGVKICSVSHPPLGPVHSPVSPTSTPDRTEEITLQPPVPALEVTSPSKPRDRRSFPGWSNRMEEPPIPVVRDIPIPVQPERSSVSQHTPERRRVLERRATFEPRRARPMGVSTNTEDPRSKNGKPKDTGSSFSVQTMDKKQPAVPASGVDRRKTETTYPTTNLATPKNPTTSACPPTKSADPATTTATTSVTTTTNQTTTTTTNLTTTLSPAGNHEPQRRFSDGDDEKADERRRLIEAKKREIREKHEEQRRQMEEEQSKAEAWEKSLMESYRNRAQVMSEKEREEMMLQLVKEWEVSKNDVQFRTPMIEAEAKIRGLRPNDDGKYVIGKGGFGVIYLVECHNTLATMKFLNAPSDDAAAAQAEFLQELDMLMRLRHPHVLLYLGGSAKPTEPKFFLTELMDADLLHIIGKKDPKGRWNNQGKYFARDIAAALTYVHGKNMVHKDMKSSNILIKRGIAKLADFGLAKVVENKVKVTMDRAYSAAWASPEQLNPQAKISFPTDIFSFAIIVWEMLTFRLPWQGLNDLQMIFANASGQFPQYHLDHIPPESPQEIVELLQKCWDLTPENRPSARDCLLIIEAHLGSNP